MREDSRLTIGTLADAAGVGRETVRFYERKGLVADPPRSEGGYRLYPRETIGRLRFIRRAQELGFTLSEIARLLELRAEDEAACEAVEARARRKLADVESKIEDLTRIGNALDRLIEKCKARQPTGECPILEELQVTERKEEARE